MAEAAYIVAIARTAGGKKGGRLAGWHPADLQRKSSTRWWIAYTAIPRWWKT
jgi:hypothetical protein